MAVMLTLTITLSPGDITTCLGCPLPLSQCTYELNCVLYLFCCFHSAEDGSHPRGD